LRYLEHWFLFDICFSDAAIVLHNKFGDCKDKATLMSALLAAKGIASEHALINFGNAYTLPEPPTMVALNHVILYLPEFDLYDDPTASLAGFGVLAPETYDKPVVRVSATGTALARTRAMRVQDHTAYAHTTITVAADGTVTGHTAERNTGVFGFVLRLASAAVQNVGSDNAARLQLQSYHTPGSGRFDLGNATETADPVVVEESFTLNDRFKAPGPGGQAVIPVGMPLTVRPGNFLLGTFPNNRTVAYACYAGRQIEDIDATFDEAQQLPVAPPPVTIDNGGFSYRATFKVEGRTLKIHREFVSLVAHQTCEPEFETSMIGDINAVRRNVNIGYTFQRPAAAVTPVALTKVAPTTTGLAPAPTAPKVVEVNRTVAADHKMRLAFFYDINPDCTSSGFATTRVIEKPKHGTISIDNGTGFTSFPEKNVRFECNKRKSDGVVVMYEPEPGYTGSDSVDVDTIFPSGSLSKHRYAIDVR